MEKYKLELTTSDLSVIDRALQEMPFRLAAPLIAKINSQIQGQQSSDNTSPS